MPHIVIEEGRCKGCGLCTIACPRNLIRPGQKLNVHGTTLPVAESMQKCTGCALCAEMCPDVAIDVFK